MECAAVLHLVICESGLMELLKVVKAFPVSGELEIGLKIKLSETETFKIAIEKVKNKIGYNTW